MWKNKILSIENLTKKKCNKLLTATCVMCHFEIESVDYLFLQCPFVKLVWVYFINLMQLPERPRSMSLLWESRKMLVRSSLRIIRDLVIKAIVWIGMANIPKLTRPNSTQPKFDGENPLWPGFGSRSGKIRLVQGVGQGWVWGSWYPTRTCPEPNPKSEITKIPILYIYPYTTFF